MKSSKKQQESDAVEFAEWLLKDNSFIDGDEIERQWFHYGKGEPKTSIEMYQLFKSNNMETLTKEQEKIESLKRMEIIKKRLEVKETENGAETFFRYNEAMKEYADLVVADRDKRILVLEKLLHESNESICQIWKLAPPQSTTEIICNEILEKLKLNLTQPDSINKQ